MSIASALQHSNVPSACPHPNELDLRRIVRTITERTRYRYVNPAVLPVEQGYLIRSECCSRKVDPDGGKIDIAMILWDRDRGEWSLQRKDHPTSSWVEDGRYARLPEALLRINADPLKLFWQ